MASSRTMALRGDRGISKPALPGSGQTPLRIAQAGGKRSGFLKQRVGKPAADLQREAQTLWQRAAEHGNKIKNRVGYRKMSDDPMIQAQSEAGRTRHLQKEIDNFTQQAEICEELVRELVGGGQ